MALVLSAGPSAVAQDNDLGINVGALAAQWPLLEKTDLAQAVANCASPDTPTARLSPTTVYPEAIAIAVSRSGAMAVVSLSQHEITIFPEGPNRPSLPGLPLFLFSPVAFRISDDGRFLAYSEGSRFQIFDATTRQPVGSWNWDTVRGVQWMGDDLLVQSSDITPGNWNPDRAAVLKWTGKAFQVAVLPSGPTLKDGAPANERDEYYARYAQSDQLGQSFLRGERVYASVDQAVADNAIVEVNRLSLDGDQVYRVADKLVQVRPKYWDTVPPPGAPDPKLMILRDGRTGAVLKSAPIPDACVPHEIAVAPDGRSFALLVGMESVLSIDPDTLAVKAVYALSLPPVTQAASIAFLSSHRLVATTQGTAAPVLAYDLPGN